MGTKLVDMEPRFRKGLTLVSLALVLEVGGKLLVLLGYIIGGYAGLSFVCFHELTITISFVLSIIALFMIFSRRRTLGKQSGFAVWGVVCLVLLIIGVGSSFLLFIPVIIFLDPRFFTMALVGGTMISSIFGPMVMLLPVYPLVNDKLKKKIKRVLLAIIILSVLVTPLSLDQLESLEGDFHQEFSDQKYMNDTGPEAQKYNEGLMKNVTDWLEGKASSKEVAGLDIFGGITLIPLVFIVMDLVRITRKGRKKRPTSSHPYMKAGGTAFQIPEEGSPQYTMGRKEKGKRGKQYSRGETKKCKFCKRKMMEEVNFCPWCGAYMEK